MQSKTGNIASPPEKAGSTIAPDDSMIPYAICFEDAPIGMAITTMNGKVLHLNKALLSLTGYSKEESSRINASSLYKNPKERERFISRLRKKNKVENIETTFVHKDGYPIQISMTSVLISLGPEEALMTMVEDITARRRIEKELKISQQAIETSISAIAMSDLNGKLCYVNPACLRTWGYDDPSQVLGKAAPSFVQSWEEALMVISEILEKGRCAGELVAKRADGTMFDAQLAANVVWDTEGNPIRLMASFSDVTERKQAENALRESEMRYRSLFENMLSGSAYCKILFDDGSPRDFIYLEVNSAFEKLTGLKNVVGRKVSDVIPGIHKSNPELLQFYGRVALTGKPERFEMYVEPLAIWFSVSVYSPEKEYFVAVFDNITERKQAHDELRRYSEEIRDLYDNAPCGYHSLDAYGTFIRINDTELNWLGSTRDDLVGKKKFSDFMTPESREVFKRNYPLFKEKGWIKDVEYQLTRRDGTLLPVILNATAIKDSEGNFIQSRASLFDNTERRKIEEERKGLEERLQRSEKMESLGMLAGGVAHDLNNVLGILIGYSELIAEEIDESSSIRPHIKYIQQGGERAAAIVQDLLTLARRGVQTKEVVNLNAIITDAEESPELEKILSFHPGVRIKTKFDADPLYIEGSPVHLSKTLMNLISNAAEAMKAGGLLTLATCNGYLDRPVHGYGTVREGDYAILTVSDTGEGISASAMKRIFEPFYTKKVMGRSGTGLGLAVVWGTVRDHNGYINVESKEGKGTTFTLYIPATREDISGEQKPISVHEYIGNGETVLIVDNEEGQRELAYRMLKKLNYEAMTVSSGEEAVEYLRKNKVDLVVLDMIMDPGMDGLDTYKKILEIYPKQKSIIVSGFSESDRVRQAQELGAGAYVRKPYLQERLGTAVKKELNTSM